MHGETVKFSVGNFGTDLSLFDVLLPDLPHTALQPMEITCCAYSCTQCALDFLRSFYFHLNHPYNLKAY